ncbi:TonB-dependent receptor [Desertivirga brevis]|uniref:TonB-dependent receptor n=1 Tax=Desertivirga brevis TaxID=2810310 RepID=UPI001A9581F7|nr:carboxypeptidase regulatory-like domain-containing protein [Pedobacter sp. SYSU D00873]
MTLLSYSGTYSRIFLCLFLITFLSLVTGGKAVSQTLQVVKGQLIDKETKAPVNNATVTVKQIPNASTRSDERGFYQLEKIPLGRIDLRITKVGYTPVDLSDVQISAGKQTILNVEMEIALTMLKEITISGNKKAAKERPLNDMALVSSRMFSVEETQRYAGSVDDPSRAVAVYPGVQSGGAVDNQIIIRGNSSRGLLWRIAGMETYNPNHFSEEGSSFGGISMITSSVLANSDFSTGAFAPEYGNALSGIFDIRLRKGNPDKSEYNFQVGTLGIEAGAEGPFSAKSKASYLLKYRYSSLSLAEKAGLLSLAPSYQDLIFNMNFPVKRGMVTFYGVGGDGTNNSPAEKDSTIWKENKYNRFSEKTNSKVAITGITYTHNIRNGYIYSGLSYNLSRNSYRGDSLSNDYIAHLRDEERFTNSAVRFSSYLNYRLGNRNTIRLGGDVSLLNFNNYVMVSIDSLRGEREVLLDRKGNSSYVQAFGQWKFRPTNALTLVSGLHFLRYNLNGNYSIEPRMSASLKVSANKSISAGYGLHSRLETPSTYFTQVTSASGGTSLANKNLDLSKAHHLVMAYDWTLSSRVRFKAETYYQSLFDVPVGFNDEGTYSSINASGFNYSGNQLFNQGKGKNYGLEFTVERFFNKGSYYMLTGSLFRSLYTDILGREHSTAFDRKYLITFAGGKEWQVGSRKNNVIQLNVKMVAGGPAHFTPVDLAQSKLKGYTVRDHQNPYSLKDAFYFKPDLKIAYKKNRTSSNWSTGLDILNVTGKTYMTGQWYDEEKQEVKNGYEALGIFPNLFYRWEF